MKKLSTLLFVALFSFNAEAHYEKPLFSYGFSYLNNYPLSAMRPQLDGVNGFDIHGYGPLKGSRLQLGFSFAYGNYGNKNSKIDFATQDGSRFIADMTISNYYLSPNMRFKYDFRPYSSAIRPYAEVTGGVTFFQTSLNIWDPEDETNCEALETHFLKKDNTWTTYAGAGVEISLVSLINKGEHSDCAMDFSVFFSGGFRTGGKVDYMSVDMDDQNLQTHTGHHGSAADKSPFNVDFINTVTQERHQHHIAYVFRSPIMMYEFQFGIRMHFGK
ncbi:MAG: hypothetical protein ACK40M_13525 [Flavobacteriales bacterium]